MEYKIPNDIAKAVKEIPMGANISFEYSKVIHSGIMGDSTRSSDGVRVGFSIFQDLIDDKYGVIRAYPSFYGKKYAVKFIEGSGENGGINSIYYIAEETEHKKPEKGTNMNALRSYFEKNSDTFFTIGVCILIDHFFLRGTLREKISNIVERILDGKTKQITEQK